MGKGGELEHDKGWKWETGSGKGIANDSKNYFKDHHNTDNQEQGAVLMYGFDDVQRGDYFFREPIGRPEVEVIVGKHRNGKTADKDEATEEMVKGGRCLDRD